MESGLIYRLAETTMKYLSDLMLFSQIGLDRGCNSMTVENRVTVVPKIPYPSSPIFALCSNVSYADGSV